MTTSFEDTLKRHGMRVSKTKRAIFMILSSAQAPMSAQDIIEETNNSHFVSVYRGLDALVKAGVVKQVPIGLTYKYELSDAFKPHHHHVVCEKCGRSVNVDDPAVEALITKITRQAGMRPTNHHVEIYGLCNRHGTV